MHRQIILKQEIHPIHKCFSKLINFKQDIYGQDWELATVKYISLILDLIINFDCKQNNNLTFYFMIILKSKFQHEITIEGFVN